MKKILCVLLAMLTLSGCSTTLKKYTMTSTSLGFDTVVSFTAYTENEATFHKYENQLKEEFLHYSKLFDKYETYEGMNNIKTINDQAGKKPVKVDPVIIELLQESRDYDEWTGHRFDVTMGAVLDIWHDYRERGLVLNEQNKPASIPSMKELKAAHKNTGWDHVKIDEENSTVYIDDANVSLDVGGNAKGFAIEKIARSLDKAGLKHAILNGGGNVRLIGSKPESEHWTVGIQIPNLTMNSTDSLISLKIPDSYSIVTSGDYQRYYMADGNVMHHIIDPTTLMPARHCRSVTVLSEDSGIADTLSTALYTLSHKDGEALLKRLKEEHGIIADAVWVYDERQPKEDDSESISKLGYEIVVSEGLKDKIVK